MAVAAGGGLTRAGGAARGGAARVPDVPERGVGALARAERRARPGSAQPRVTGPVRLKRGGARADVWAGAAPQPSACAPRARPRTLVDPRAGRDRPPLRRARAGRDR